MPRRERTALFLLAGMAAYTWLVPAPRFETSMVWAAVALTALFGGARDPRDAIADRRAERWLLVYLPIVVIGVLLTRPAWSAHVPFVGLDGRINEAIVGELIDQAARGRPLTWLTRIAPGDPTLDLYPGLSHRALAWLARWLGAERETARLLVGVLSAAHVVGAVGIARCAVRVGAPHLAALCVGVLALLDVGTDFTWGTQAVFRYAFLPATLGMAALLHTLAALFDLWRQPTRARWIVGSLGAAITAALHPLTLTVLVLLVGVLAAMFCLGAPHARRALTAPLFGLVLGVASSAWLWMPASLRVLAYGVHYGAPQVPLALAAQRMALGALPDGGWMPLVAAAWLVVIAALVMSGRREARALGWLAILLVAAYVEPLFIELGLAPSEASVRWQAFRIGAALKPLAYVLGALAIGSAAELHVWAVGRSRRVWALRGLALAALGAAVWVGHADWRAGLGELSRERDADMIGPPSSAPGDLAALHGDLTRDLAMRPGGRLLLVCGLECVSELYAFARDAPDGTPGLSLALSQPAPAGFLLREQLRTVSEENLRRFGVRWAVAPDRTLLPGDDATGDRHYGRLWLRPIASWDGEIAHVVRGEGHVRAEVVPGEGFDLHLEGTQPALVELGTPYYPRLVAHDAAGPVPVYGMPVASPTLDDPNPTIEHATALWIRPGTTRVRATGALTSDGAGTTLSVVAVTLCALACWLLPPGARRRAGSLSAEELARRARAHAGRTLLGRCLPAAFVITGLALCVLFALRMRATPVDSLRLAALLPTPRVFVLDAAGQRECFVDRLGRHVRCPDGAALHSVVSYTLRDWHVGWPAPAPAIEIERARSDSRYVIELEGQPLEGTYYAQCEGCVATVRDSSGTTAFRVERPTQRLSGYVDVPQLELRTSAPTARFTVIAARFVDPAIPPPLPPPSAPSVTPRTP